MHTSRRALATGAVWAAPIIAVSAVAPAYAVSGGCVAGEAAIPTGQLSPVSQLVFPQTDVTATVGYTTTGYPSGELPYQTGWPFRFLGTSAELLGVLLTNTVAHGTVTMSLVFSRPVTGLSLMIGGLAMDDDEPGSWASHVVVDTPGYTVVDRDAAIVGSGTAADPLRNAVANSRRDTVGLVWRDPVQDVRVTFKATGSVVPQLNGIMPMTYVVIGNIGFTC